MTITSPTAGQRAALGDLKDAVEGRRPLILLFGETGAGKTSVVNAFLKAAGGSEVLAAGVSATGGEFAASPTFDTLLSAICARLELPTVAEEGPAALAGLGLLIRARADAGKAVAVAIDHADRLGDAVIAEVVRLHERLGVRADAFVRIFAGTTALAPRIETSLRQAGSDERLAEIRLSAPTADEVATILTYEDAARPGGPVLAPDAIAAICAYARSDLHLAAPMADAVRSLSCEQGANEITAELVHETLLGLWAPEQAMDAAPGLHDVAGQAMLGPASVTASGLMGLPRWAQRAKAKLANRMTPLLGLSLVGSSLLLAALVAFALLAGGEEGSPRQAAEDAQPPPVDLAAPAAPDELPVAPTATAPASAAQNAAAEDVQPPPVDPAAPAAPDELPVAPTATAPASAAQNAAAEAEAQPAEPQASPAAGPEESAGAHALKDGEVDVKPKQPRAPKPAPKPDEKRWVQTR